MEVFPIVHPDFERRLLFCVVLFIVGTAAALFLWMVHVFLDMYDMFSEYRMVALFSTGKEHGILEIQSGF